ncbi:MAG: alpha/beta hydrolase fold protein [Mycobacterium sp.]|jgi:pimeloyl-ACP methyl ester carboxylesterase|nr:alpha/beta hydrolase fold protein [Mycobacterium sp.]
MGGVHLRRDDGPGGAPVVLLHGQPGSASDWARVLPLLPAADGATAGPLRRMAVDRPGYGASTESAVDWAGNAQRLVALLQRTTAEPAVLVAHSWAGGVALETALRAPQLVRGLLLVGAVAHETTLVTTDRLLQLPGLLRLTTATFRRVGHRAIRLMETSSGSRLDPQARRWLAAEASLWRSSAAWDSFATEQEFLVRDIRALTARLGEVRVPVRLLHGTRDAQVPFSSAGEATVAIPGAQLQPVVGGHLLPWELPAAIAEAVRELVAATAAGPAATAG